MKRVIVVGGGFAGALAAKRLEKDSRFDVTLIDKKEFYEFTPSVLRTLVEPEHAKTIQVAHKDYLKKSKIIVGELNEVSENFIKVKKRNSSSAEKIEFDYLVIASGSRYSLPIKGKDIVSAGRAETLKKHNKKLLDSEKVLIVGGGIVGTELCSEIVMKYPKKEITIVHARDSLMQRQNKNARKYAQAVLENKKVNLIFEEKAVEKKKGNFVTDKKRKIETELAFLCTGIKVNSEFMKKNFSDLLNDREQIKVNSFLQMKNHKNIFVAGDVTAIKEEKTAQNSEYHAMVVSDNIINLEKGKKLRKYKSKPRIMVISLGRWNGILTYKNFTMAGLIPGVLKTLIEKRTLLKYKIAGFFS